MTGPMRKGYCPGVLAPMPARDGLLVRVRVPGGQLPAVSARRIAELGSIHGNGLIDLSQRANLQLRGVREDALDELTDGLRELGYVSDDAASEAVRNVLTNPTAGLDGTALLDARPHALALDARLAADRALHALPAKFAMVVDGGGQGHLADSGADLRFDAVPSHGGPSDGGPLFRVSAGGNLTCGRPLGLCAPGELVEIAAVAALAFLDLRAGLPDPPRRMVGLLKAIGSGPLRDRLPDLRPLSDAPAPVRPPRAVLGRRPGWLGVGFAFGRLTCDALAELSALSDEIRLTPWRALLLPGAAPGAESAAMRLGGILEAGDPHLRVAACSGAQGCVAGSTDTHTDGHAIAEAARALLAAGQSVHVSGCAKGCAHPAAADVTLTARDGAYDIALQAGAGAPAWRSGLSPTDAVRAVAGLDPDDRAQGDRPKDRPKDRLER